MPLTRQHGPRITQDPWIRLERMIGAVVAGYVVLSVLLWVRVWYALPPAVLHWGSLGMGGQALLTLGLLVTLRGLVRRHLWHPLQRRAVHDDLTGSYRPAVFWEQFAQQVALAYRQQQPLAFAFLDLDDFKQINDQYGHAIGDAVLRVFGQHLAGQARAGDIVGRLGGEEFGWLLPGATVAEAQAAVERFLTRVRAAPREEIPAVTFSGGVAGVTGRETPPVSVWELAEAADRALYRVKAAGKAQIAVASSLST